MKIKDNTKGYITPALILILIIPLIILLMHITDTTDDGYINTQKYVKSDKLTKITQNYKQNMQTDIKQAISEVSGNLTLNMTPLANAQKTLKDVLQQKMNYKMQQYEKTHNINITCNIVDVKPSDDPFKIKVIYIICSKVDMDMINQTNTIEIPIESDDKTIIYDPLLLFQFNTKNDTNNTLLYQDTSIASVYAGATSGYIIQKCPYENYNTHGTSNITFNNCLLNHYYHRSHDGVCFICRLENKTKCSHMGIETFIIPVVVENTSIVSVDHVLFNEKYNGNRYDITNSTFLYLDGGHKIKYGL